MLTNLEPQRPKNGKNGKSTKHRKTRDFLAGGSLRRQAVQPLSPTGRRELPYGNATARRNLSAYARQPGRGPTMLAHLVAMLAYVGLSCGLCWPSLGLCCPSLGLCWPFLKAMWADLEAYVGRSGGPC